MATDEKQSTTAAAASAAAAAVVKTRQYLQKYPAHMDQQLGVAGCDVVLVLGTSSKAYAIQ
jgi:hypothetical protein